MTGNSIIYILSITTTFYSIKKLNEINKLNELQEQIKNTVNAAPCRI